MSTATESAGPRIGSVLIVDDSAVQRHHGVRLCSALGIERVFQASNGREALALLEHLQPLPELMIVDLEMPTMDGPQLIEQLQQRGVDIPIIVASTHERVLIQAVQDMGSVLGLRILAAVQKPLTAAALAEALSNPRISSPRREQAATLPIDESSLRHALEAQQISVAYQPQVDIRTGIVRGVEALARWEHPTLGQIPPDQFVALAERSDLIHSLTMHIMNEALLQTAAWKARGLHLSASINLSPLLLERGQIAQDITSLQESHGLGADQIVLEMTEGSLVSCMGTALGVLTRLRLRGFGLSIDDYGTGFASMQQLARIPFTELKIDRSFVRGAHERENLQVILRSALDMARQLRLTTVAEGVETLEDWRLLQQYGCTLAQGWLIAQAMPGAQLASWQKRHRQRLAQLRGPAITESSLPDAQSRA